MRMVASDVERFGLAAALASRGLTLSPLDRRAIVPGTAALLIDGRAEGRSAHGIVGSIRNAGWCGPLMLLGANVGSVADALDAGADDAALADAPAPEIAARLAARMRGVTITVGDLVLDLARRSAVRADRELALLPREFALLRHLAERAGHCVSRAELLRAVWQLRFDPGTNVVAVHISRLRARLDAGCSPMLHTDRGRGYRLTP